MKVSPETQTALEHAAAAIASADAMLIGAGAGMGSIPGFLIFVVMRAFGRLIRRFGAGVLQRCRIRGGSVLILLKHGDSSDTGSIFIETQRLMLVSRRF